jgi:hypothetical protein
LWRPRQSAKAVPAGIGAPMALPGISVLGAGFLLGRALLQLKPHGIENRESARKPDAENP